MIATMQRTYALLQQILDVTHQLLITNELNAVTDELRDHIADFDDFFRPIRNYLYWEPHCFNIPICWAIRSIFEALDGSDQISVKMHRPSQKI